MNYLEVNMINGSYFSDWPDELSLYLFKQFSFKETLHYSCVCKSWKSLLEDASIWTLFLNRLDGNPEGIKQEFDKNFSLKDNIISHLKALKAFKEDDGLASTFVKVHIILSRFGLSSLTFVHQWINNKASEGKYSALSSRSHLASEYIKTNHVEKAEEILSEASHDSCRGEISCNLINYYIKNHNLEQASACLEKLKYSDYDADKSLCLFMHAAEKTNRILLAITTLNNTQEFRIWAACAKSLIECLNANQTFEEVKPFFLWKTEKCNTKTDTWDIKYCLYTGELDKAEKIALLADKSIKESCLSLIKEVYSQGGDIKNADRIAALKHEKS
jgi:hypothetical protein